MTGGVTVQGPLVERTVRIASDDIVLDVPVVVDEGEDLYALLLGVFPHQEQPFLEPNGLSPTGVLDNQTVGLLLFEWQRGADRSGGQWQCHH